MLKRRNDISLKAVAAMAAYAAAFRASFHAHRQQLGRCVNFSEVSGVEVPVCFHGISC